MEFLRFLAFVATWGFMWRWVVKNRGSWNLFYGNLVGAAGGFIVGVVVLSITLSLLPSADKPRKQIEETAAQAVAPAVAKPETLKPPVIVQKPAPAPDKLPTFTAGQPQNEPSPPESALLPNYRNRVTESISEKTQQDKYDEAFALIRAQVGNDPGADQSPIASVMCIPFVRQAMRFPASAFLVENAPESAQRFKDQIYTISNTITARNMLGDDISYRFDCSLQRIAGTDAGFAAWKLLDLKLQKSGS
ncbi:hypothetical protein ACX64O_22705 [Pseudomonas fitomaticsae]|uniref:Tim44-like domain-containing protein n=2 Tax=Pseudomonas fitomaticsae TaxID=2837969 RepID=A0ABY3PZJ2_9PSED|nr:hypothetical protein KJY40_24820 [Pseudomonas fitomaticsae]